MKKVIKRSLSVFLAVALLCVLVPFTGLTGLTASATGYAPGDIITFGSYPQTKVTDSSLITNLNTLTLSAENTVTYNDTKYKKVYFTTTTNLWQAINGYNINTVYWFKFEPIQWRILSNISGELFVLAEKILDLKAYNQLYTNVTWESCTMRSWLNSNFYNSAFSSIEKLKINTSTIVNGDNPDFGTDGGNNTNDKLYLLSSTDVTNTSYGFSSNHGAYDTARQTQGTDFSKSGGLHVSTSSSYLGNSSWWLRTPGTYQSGACNVNFDGYVQFNSDGVNATTVGVRPAFKISLTSDIFTSKTGSNSRIDCIDNMVYGLTPCITSLDDYVDVAVGYELAYVPTVNGFGTGTVVNVTKDGETVESYIILIYGDVNGDGAVDSIDAGTMVDYENYLISWEPVTDARYMEAGDLNGDGSIDSIDAGITVDTENYLSFINQVTGIGAAIEAIDGSVVITGLPKFGNTLTADTSNITPGGATLTYAWKRSGTVIGTEKTYVVTSGDVSKSITVTVTGFGGFSGAVRSAAVMATPAIISGTINITGTLKYGETLAVDTSNIDPSAATLNYQWQRGEVSIGSENTYTTTIEDIGQPISITITGTGVYEGSLTSAAVTPAKADTAVPAAPTLKSKTLNSVTLNAVDGQEHRIDGGTWQASAAFTGLNSNSEYNFYTRFAETATHKASDGSTPLNVTTDKAPISGTVIITGTPKAGETLSADTAGVLPEAATLSYRWRSSDTMVGTNSTYTVEEADIGESITVTVTGTGDYTGSITSDELVITE